MRERLPPLRALLAFEAAARSGSFARAASELNVTPSAISHQIQTIETFLGLKLFRRTAGRVSLTRAGNAYWRRIESALQAIADATAEIAPARQADLVTVLSATSFAAKWLRPRLNDFLSTHPMVRVRLNTSTEPPDFSAGSFDVAICYGRPAAPGLTVLPLVAETMMPLCSPRLARRLRLRKASDLAKATLIHSSNLTSWADWLEQARAPAVKADAGVWFDRSSLAIESAVEGTGVILESDFLTSAERKAGMLTSPFSSAPRIRVLSYFLAFRAEQSTRPACRTFIDWIRASVPKPNRPGSSAKASPAAEKRRS
jgi:LysR family glycine cleavage system transcriptional activator